MFSLITTLSTIFYVYLALQIQTPAIWVLTGMIGSLSLCSLFFDVKAMILKRREQSLMRQISELKRQFEEEL